MVATLLAPPDPSPALAPGGYWSTSELRERRGEPPDGEDELTIGSVLFSLGILRTGAAGVTIWLARTPGRCPVESGCGPMEIYGWVGFGEGGLMVGTGLTYLIIGAARRSRHRRWEAGESVMRSRPWPGIAKLEIGPWMLGAPNTALAVGGGAQLRLRF